MKTSVIWFILGMLIISVIFCFVIVFVEPSEPVYSGSVGGDRSKYDCMLNPDACHLGGEKEYV